MKAFKFLDRVRTINVESRTVDFGCGHTIRDETSPIITLNFDQGTRVRVSRISNLDADQLVNMARGREQFEIIIRPLKQVGKVPKGFKNPKKKKAGK